jgi:hypothetical protein
MRQLSTYGIPTRSVRLQPEPPYSDNGAGASGTTGTTLVN